MSFSLLFNCVKDKKKSSLVHSWAKLRVVCSAPIFTLFDCSFVCNQNKNARRTQHFNWKSFIISESDNRRLENSNWFGVYFGHYFIIIESLNGELWLQAAFIDAITHTVLRWILSLQWLATELPCPSVDGRTDCHASCIQFEHAVRSFIGLFIYFMSQDMIQIWQFEE